MNRLLDLARIGFAVALLGLLSPLAQAQAQGQREPELKGLIERAMQQTDCFADKFEQQVWFVAMQPQLAKLVKDQAEREDILTHVQCEAKRLGLPPALVMAVIDVESRFDRWAVSSAGAVGLMQVMPFWPQQLGMKNEQLVHIPQNIRMGCTILKFYLDREKGDYTKALARYNGSTGRRNYADLVLTRLANRWQFQ